MTPLGRLLAPIREAHGGYQDIAAATGISLSAIVRATKRDGVLGTMALLQLSEAIGESPSKVLRAGGKADVADILRRLYPGETQPLSALDRALVALPVAKKRAVLELLD